MLSLIVNGKPATIERPVSLLDFLEQRQINPQIIAVEYNGEIIRRGAYGHVTINDGDRLEIVRMVGGGAPHSVRRLRVLRRYPALIAAWVSYADPADAVLYSLLPADF